MTSTPTQFADPMATRLKAVQSLIEAGKLPQAAEKLNSARAMGPNDPRVYLLGMLLAEAAGNPDGALQSGQRALELGHEWPVAVTEVALLLARQNKFDDAIALATRAVKLDGDNPALLGRVIDIAHRAKRLDMAIPWLERAIKLVPDNLHIQYLLARDHAETGAHQQALDGLEPLLRAKPNDPILLICRLKSRLALGHKQAAIEDGDALLALEPENPKYRFWRELAAGTVPPRYPPSMVQEMYDGFAETFDQHLVGTLKYTLPGKVATAIRSFYPDNTLNVLDLGCGTGLLGASLGRINGALVGVELSYKMIEQAGKHGVYDRFHNVDLVGALQDTPQAQYDVITALDVLIYIGELGETVSNAYRILKPGGRLICTFESAGEDESDLVFRSTQRFAHKPGYVESLCRAAGFEDVSIEPVTLRFEAGKAVEGFLAIARKPA